ncbi:MAG: potassium-transporting ATPase subunit KdpC [Bacteroidota bacterium]
MKTNIMQSVKITLVLMILLCVIYPISIMLAGKLTPGGGNGETLSVNGKVVGYATLGQKFSAANYFWGRPSAVGYNAAGSAGSNKGPSNPDYLAEVGERIDTLLKYHPGLKKAEIPADLVTASGSGLDPDISPQAAKIQTSRIAAERRLPIHDIEELVARNTESPFFGPAKVNVLRLNIALDQITKK